jgi:hypothetical protein
MNGTLDVLDVVAAAPDGSVAFLVIRLTANPQGEGS